MAARLNRSGILYDGCYAHVISRSIRRLNIFHDNHDFRTFLGLMLTIKKESGFRIYHYCLMPTHFHLAVAIPDIQRFSKSIQRLKSLYIYRFHERNNTSGPIWRERYRSLLIESEPYLYACGRYIENNPVQGGLTARPQDWPYSSSRYYFERQPDQLVEGYSHPLPEIPKGMDITDEAIFEHGVGIGTSFFRFQLNENLKSRQSAGPHSEINV